MSDDLATVDAAIAKLNADYRRDGYVLVRRRKVGVHYCDRDGQPTGAPLMRFDASLVPGAGRRGRMAMGSALGGAGRRRVRPASRAPTRPEREN